MQIIIWFISLLIFAWCYSTFFNCLINIKTIPVAKISIIVYMIIIVSLYLISFFFIEKYFTDILICSIIVGVLGFITSLKIR